MCEDEGLWFHVDGAFGALAALSPRLRPLTAGMNRADSLAFDLHKWMYMCTKPDAFWCATPGNTFAPSPDPPRIWLTTRAVVASGNTWFSELGLQLSRGFRALKIWMSLKEHGLDRYRRMIEQNVEQAAYLAGLIEQQPDLELMAPVPLNIVCFRFVDRALDEFCSQRIESRDPHATAGTGSCRAFVPLCLRASLLFAWPSQTIAAAAKTSICS